jgi:hypothetical protein
MYRQYLLHAAGVHAAQRYNHPFGQTHYITARGQYPLLKDD